MPEELKFWNIPPFFYFIRKTSWNGVEAEILVQFDKDYWFEIMPGTEFYYKTKQRIKALKPVGYSVGYEALKKHIAHCMEPFTINQQEAA